MDVLWGHAQRGRVCEEPHNKVPTTRPPQRLAAVAQSIASARASATAPPALLEVCMFREHRECSIAVRRKPSQLADPAQPGWGPAGHPRHRNLKGRLIGSFCVWKLRSSSWRECRLLLTPAARIYPASPFCAIETNQVLRLQNPIFTILKCSGAAPGWFLLVLLRKTRKNARKAALFSGFFFPRKLTHRPPKTIEVPHAGRPA